MLAQKLLIPLAAFFPSDAAADNWPMFQHDAAHSGYSNTTMQVSPISAWNFTGASTGASIGAASATGAATSAIAASAITASGIVSAGAASTGAVSTDVVLSAVPNTAPIS